jgi:AraC-like DNA-binding protein
VDSIVPDACMELIVHVGAPFLQWADGVARPQPRSILVGQIRRPLAVQSAGRVATVGVRFRPSGARPFFALDFGEIAGRVVALSGVFGRAADELEERLADGSGPAAWSRIIQAWLLRQACHPADSLVEGVVAEILRSGGRTRVDALGAAAGLGQRQLARRFRASVGLGPKAMSRIVRVQAVLRDVGRRPSSWIDAALDHGYSDQAHLIRDFVEIAGRTPPAWREEETAFAARFTAPDRLDAFFAC